MRKKIKQLAYGKFDYNEPNLSLSTERIELEVTEGKDGAGGFTIHGNAGERVRGIVYSTHPRMECLTPQFDGEEILVRYQFHSEGLHEGDVRKGEFVIVCDQGEYNLSFVVSVSKAYAKTSVGKIRYLSDFVRLAHENFNEAYQVFYSIGFSYILKDADAKERMLYEAIRKETPSLQAVEAYLTGIGKKPPVKVSLEQKQFLFTNITTDRKEQLCFKKNHWGYVSCKVKADAAFIRLEKTDISSEDFLGNTCFFDYYIDAAALHAGKNYGRILFEFPENVLAFEICAMRAEEKNVTVVSGHYRQLKYKAKLTRLYMDYRMQKMVTGVWAKQSVQVLERLLEEEPENDLYRLMKAQAFLMNRQRQEADWILEDYKRTCGDKTTPVWGYYLYLSTLMEQEASYVDRLTGQIEELFCRHPESPLLFWVLLFLREDYYRNPAYRLKAIERWVEKGCDSPFFYLEAYQLYCRNPYLLAKLDGFELKILNWARKQQAISEEIAMQVLQLVPAMRSYDEKVFQFLVSIYDIADREEVTAAICSYLIKGQKFSKEYHKWYVLGIEREVRITNLYEAYLLSADKNSIRQTPKVIFMYFQYHNTLSYRQLALLYAYLIQNKETYRKVYQNYRRTIEQFAMLQIEAGHIDENLAIVYQDMLQFGILNRRLAEKLADILFVHKLQIVGTKQFVRAVVLQKQWKQHQTVSIVEGVAYFKAFTEDYCILLQDSKGRLFAEEKWYEESSLLEADAYLDAAMGLAGTALPYLIHSFDKKQKKNEFTEKDEEGFSVLLESPDVSEEWKTQIQIAFVRHFAGKEFGSQMESCLKYANYKMMQPKDRRFMIEQMVENHLFEQAYEMLHLYGHDAVGSRYRVTLCSYEILNCDYEDDEFLIGLANEAFSAGKYNDVILRYLCKYYNGQTKHMAAIWKAARESDVDTFDMEERIITQMLYSTDYIELIDSIYDRYCEKGGKDLICMAYLSYFSHLYLRKNTLIPKEVFLQIEHRMLLHQDVNDVHGYALLKHYSEVARLTDGQYRIADGLLMEYTCSNVYFAFYKSLDERLLKKYHLHDKYFVEYHSKPGACANISYYINDETLHTEELNEVCEGIFVKAFILFFGDKLSYYVTETDEQNGRSVTLSGQLENQDVYEGQEHNRYAMLNDIYANVILQDGERAAEYMKEYSRKKISTEQVFKLL